MRLYTNLTTLILSVLAFSVIASPVKAQTEEVIVESEPRCYIRFRGAQLIGLDFAGIKDADRIIVFQNDTPIANLRGRKTQWNASDELSTPDGPLSIKLNPSRETYDCLRGTSSISGIEPGDDLLS